MAEVETGATYERSIVSPYVIAYAGGRVMCLGGPTMKRSLLLLVLVPLSLIGIACEMPRKPTVDGVVDLSDHSDTLGARFVADLRKAQGGTFLARRVTIDTVEKKIVNPPRGAVEVTFRRWKMAVPDHFTTIFAPDTDTPGLLSFIGPEFGFYFIDGKDGDLFIDQLRDGLFPVEKKVLISAGVSEADAANMVKETSLRLAALPGERLFKMIMDADGQSLLKCADARECLEVAILLRIRFSYEPLGAVTHWSEPGRQVYMWQRRPWVSGSEPCLLYHLLAYGNDGQATLCECSILLCKEQFGSGDHKSLIMSCFRGNENDQEK